MTLCKRLIARLDVKGSRLIKGIRFEGLRVLGDPCEAALQYAHDGVDELLYIDAVASLYGRNGLVDLLRRTSREVFIPITAGGGVRSVEDAAALLAAGADKIAVNTAALERPELITELAEFFGSQCVVASIQARRTAPDAWEAMGEAGRERTGRDVAEWIDQLQRLGAGELLLTSVDQDGTCAGPDQPLLEMAAARTFVPLVVGGGFAATDQLQIAWQQPNISAVSLGAALHHQRLDPVSVKRELESSLPSLSLRLSATAQSLSLLDEDGLSLAGFRIGVIDYGMGNQQSLINALEFLGAEVLLSDQPDQMRGCDVLALPGVGAFPKGMAALRSRSLDAWLCQEWVAAGQPLLGICLGMQMLFETSEEFGECEGLGLLQGRVTPLPDHDIDGERMILPHMGWNRLLPGPASLPNPSFASINQYFVHSYAATMVDPAAVMFYCRYRHQPFVAGVRQGPVAGFQFHPERSGSDGLALLGAICREIHDSAHHSRF
jgi:imidazole glycerol phosphate synthase glutamine amidotransferase subunit